MSAPAGSTVMLNAGGSFSGIVMVAVPISAGPWLAATVIVSAGSTSVSSSASTVVVPAVAPAASVMLRVVIV